MDAPQSPASQLATSTPTVASADDPIAIEPGRASCESMLITTDSIDEFVSTYQTSASGASGDPRSLKATTSNISEIQDELHDHQESHGPALEEESTSDTPKGMSSTANSSLMSKSFSEEMNALALECEQSNATDHLRNVKWVGKSDHVFILSTAGKPIYTLHGNEDKLATIFGVMLALVSVVQSNQDTIMSIHAKGGMKIVFLVKPPLILVAVSKSRLSVQQIQLQLNDVYNQILYTLTLAHLNKIFEKRTNFDLRRLLAGSERLIDHLLAHRTNGDEELKLSNNTFIFLTHAVRILPISSSIRESITNTIQNNCYKIKNLVFAVLIANNKLIASVRIKKYSIHPADLRLMFNLVECTESFKTAESWTPICLPKFDSKGYMYAHISYLSDDCQACLLLLSVQNDAFYTLSDAKKKITDRLRRTNCLRAINDAMLKTINLRTIGIPEMRHFLYKSRSNAQLLCSELMAPYSSGKQFRRLETLYYDIHHRIHNTSRPLKLIYESKEKEVMLAWVTTGYELYAAFEPVVNKNMAITLVNKLLYWIKKEEETLFILNSPTF